VRILAIDPGRSLGYCHGEPGGKPIFGSLRLTAKFKSQRDLALLNLIVDLIRGNAITDVYVEKPVMSSATMSFDALVTLYGYATVVGLASAMTGASCAFIPIQTWRGQIGAPTSAPKQVKGTDARRKWLKAAIMQHIARVFGIETDDDNAAEAVGIWLAMCDRKMRPIMEPGFDFDRDVRI